MTTAVLSRAGGWLGGQPARRWLDLAALTICVAVAATVGRAAPREMAATGRQPFFYQGEFGPAVAVTCGLGFGSPSRETPGLAAFLQLQADSFSCAQLPAGARLSAPTAFASISRYLELSVAAVWSMRGISWSALDVLYAIFAAIVAAALYGLFRLGTGAALAAVGTLLVVTSPLHVTYLPGLRDYAKAPFLLVLLLLIAWMIVWPARPGRLAALAVAAGLVLGIGLGFRNDLLLAIAPLLLTLAVLVPSGYSIRHRLWSVVLCVSTFLAAGAPIIAAYRAGNNSGHVVMLGLTAPFERPLGIVPGPYQIGHLYRDGYVLALVSSEVDRVRGGDALLKIGSAEYDAATMDVLRRTGRARARRPPGPGRCGGDRGVEVAVHAACVRSARDVLVGVARSRTCGVHRQSRPRAAGPGRDSPVRRGAGAPSPESRGRVCPAVRRVPVRRRAPVQPAPLLLSRVRRLVGPPDLAVGRRRVGMARCEASRPAARTPGPPAHGPDRLALMRCRTDADRRHRARHASDSVRAPLVPARQARAALSRIPRGAGARGLLSRDGERRSGGPVSRGAPVQRRRAALDDGDCVPPIRLSRTSVRIRDLPAHAAVPQPDRGQ